MKLEFTEMRFAALVLVMHALFVVHLFTGSAVSWAVAFLVFVALTLVSTVFYHRLLSHSAWPCHPLVRKVGIFIGIFSATGTPLTRTAVHRAHHRFSDGPGDPHSPHHFSALQIYFPQFNKVKFDIRQVKDLIRDDYVMFIHRTYLLWIIGALIVLPFEWAVVWGSAATLTWMNIFICNYFCHRGDQIADNRLLGLLTFGEGHHRHHHEHQQDARFGAWDPGYLLVKALSCKKN